MPERITSRSNARVRALRSALSGRRGDVVGIESPHLLREAVNSGLHLQTLFLREDQESFVYVLPHGAADEVVLLSADAFDSAAATDASQGVAATLLRPTPIFQPALGDLLLLADGLQDPGNLGTLLRSAEAFGAAAVALAPGTVDPWNGKCMRASAGAAFRMPMPSWNESLLHALRHLGTMIYAAVARGGAPAHGVDLRGTAVLVIGNEGAGVSDALLRDADERITLHTTGLTESLNAAIAGSLLLYEAALQRAGARGTT